MTAKNRGTAVKITFGEHDPQVDMANKLQQTYPRHLILIHSGGAFVQVFNQSAYLLHTLKQYKLTLGGTTEKPHIKAGFPYVDYKQRLWSLTQEHGLAYVIHSKTGSEISAEESSALMDAISPDIVHQVIEDLLNDKALQTAILAKALANPETQPFLLKTKAEALDDQLLQDIIKLPRDIRCTWGENVRQTMQRIMRNTYLYGNEDNKPQLLKQLSADIDLLKHYISQAKALNRFKFSFKHRVGLVVELGRILGGLQRAQKVGL